MSGWIKLHRQLKINGHFHMPDRALKVWVYILLSVSHLDVPHRDVRKGEGWISYTDIAKDCGTSPERPMRREAVGSALRYLEEHGYIEREIRPGVGQKITVLNWHKYQGTGSDTEPLDTSTGSPSGPDQFRKRTGPVPQADQSDPEAVRLADRTSSANEPHQSAQRTAPVRPADQSIYKDFKKEEKGEEKNAPLSLSEDEIQNELQRVARHHESAIGMFNPSMFGDFQFWIVEKGMTSDVVCAAIDRGVEVGVTRWSYIEAIIRNWHNEGVRTLDDVTDRNRKSSAQRPMMDEQADKEYLDRILGVIDDDAGASA